MCQKIWKKLCRDTWRGLKPFLKKVGSNMKKSLIVFYSREGNNYVNGVIQNLQVGNTKVVAEMIHEITGADLFQLEPVVSYHDDYNICIEEAQIDKVNNARPELKSLPENVSEYDLIYLVYPNYWGTMPMHICTFLEQFDFTNKIIKPLCTHEGSGLGDSVADIKKLCPKAKVEKGLAIAGGSVSTAKSSIANWV